MNAFQELAAERVRNILKEVSKTLVDLSHNSKSVLILSLELWQQRCKVEFYVLYESCRRGRSIDFALFSLATLDLLIVLDLVRSE